MTKQIVCPTSLLHPQAKVPERGSELAGGHDIFCVGGIEGLTNPADWSHEQLEAWYRQGLHGAVTISPGDSFLFRTGMTQAIDPDYLCLLWDRSGMGAKKVVHRLAGVIDPDYTGEWFVRVVNHSAFLVTIHNGDKIVQGVYQERVEAVFPLVPVLPPTDRGSQGFGSTDLPAVAPLPVEYAPMGDFQPAPTTPASSEAATPEVVIPPTPVKHVYNGAYVGQAMAALRDRQPDNAVAWMERDLQSFPNGVPTIQQGSLMVVSGRQAIEYKVLT